MPFLVILSSPVLFISHVLPPRDVIALGFTHSQAGSGGSLVGYQLISQGFELLVLFLILLYHLIILPFCLFGIFPEGGSIRLFLKI
jgi:hypothetical protein